MKKKTNMYSKSKKQWNPFIECGHDCKYCRKSFQAQLKRRGGICRGCRDFIPHPHLERLNRSLPKTKYGQFIFTVSSGDIAFCNKDYLIEIVTRIRQESHKTFLIQSKDPKELDPSERPQTICGRINVADSNSRPAVLVNKE